MKKILSIVMIACMLMSLCAVAAFADECEHDWELIPSTNRIQLYVCRLCGERKTVDPDAQSDPADNTGDDTDDNIGDNKGDNTGDNKGDNTGDNKGDNTGDNKGDNTGDNKGDNTGDNKGDNTGDNKGDNTGDNKGDNTGDNKGDNTGDNTKLYTITQGATVPWVKGSEEGFQFIIKRSENDETTFSHFVGIEVDGKALKSDDYTAVEGSVVARLKTAYMETLSVGSHTVRFVFDDGAVETTLKIDGAGTSTNADTTNNSNNSSSGNSSSNGKKQTSGKAPNSSPKTGDETDLTLWSVLLGLSLCGMLCVYAYQRKARKTNS